MSARPVSNYEFTLSAQGALLTFEAPHGLSDACLRPDSPAPGALWDPDQSALVLLYARQGSPERVLFENPPDALRLHLTQLLPFVACQARDGAFVKAHFCQPSPLPR